MERPAFRGAHVAFVVLTWNSERCVRACLGSVLSLACAELDVYVEDNGSSDGTCGILRDFAEVHPNLHVEYLDENLGTTVPRNRAIRRALAAGVDYVCVLDSDTVVNQLAFEALADALRTDPSIGVVGPTMANSAGAIQLSGRNLPTLGIKIGKACPFGRAAERAAAAERPAAPIGDNGLQDVGYLLSACWLAPASAFESVGLLDEAIFYAPEDVDWCLRCHGAGLRVVRMHGAQIIHEYQRLSHGKLISRTNFEHIKGLVHFFKKHGYLFRAPSFSGIGDN